MTLKDIDNSCVLNTYKRFDLYLTHGKGSLVYDENEKEYIDLTSGIGVTAFGLCDDVWVDAVTKQLNTLQHMSNLYYTSPCALLAQKICERTNMSKVFFSNSGAEANECAIKVARKYMAEKKGKDCYNILTLKNSFHGRTITTLAATGQDKFHEAFTPLTEGFVYADANNLDEIMNIAKENNVAAIMMECIQGEGGVNVLKKEVVEGIKKYCDDNDTLLIVDEVQTGNGRTGTLYGYMNYNITPDIFTTAKGLGGGLPIGACIVNKKVENAMGYGDHGSTFGGNPICCAGAISIIDRLTDEFLEDINKKGDIVRNMLKDNENVEAVVGMGLMIGIKTKKDVSEVIKKCIENGVLVLTAKDKIRLLPALNIEEQTLRKAISIIIDCLK